MPSLSVGGVTIPVTPGGISRDRLDMVDRARAFDGTYRASATGNPKREFLFSTPPVTRERADFYEQILGSVAAQVCSGDILAGGANELLWSEDFANAIWAKTTTTVTAGISDPFGGTLAHTLTATAGSSDTVQSPANSTSIVRTVSFWLRRRTGTGTINIATPDNVSYIPQTVTTTWQRFSATGAASVTRWAEINIATSGDEVDVFGAQLEPGTTPGTYRRTTTAAVASTLSPLCCTEITGWSPVRVGTGHYVVLGFTLHEQ